MAYDIEVFGGPSVYLVRPLTDAGKAWMEEHIAITPETLTFFAGAVAVEHRYINDIVAGMTEAGLRILRSYVVWGDIMTERCFKLGKLAATPGALVALERNHLGPFTFYERHASGDWGEGLDDEDVASNQQALHDGTRIMSAYVLPDGTKLWCITEADRSVTTLLLPDEY